MKKTFLMPHWCKIAGWAVMVPVIVAWLAYLFSGAWFHYAFFDWADGGGSPVHEFVNDHIVLFVVLSTLSTLMVAFSREKDEDEYIASIRGKYLILSFYIFAALFLTLSIVFDLWWFDMMFLQMFVILLLHIAMFNISMAVIRRRRSREE